MAYLLRNFDEKRVQWVVVSASMSQNITRSLLVFEDPLQKTASMVQGLAKYRENTGVT